MMKIDIEEYRILFLVNWWNFSLNQMLTNIVPIDESEW